MFSQHSAKANHLEFGEKAETEICETMTACVSAPKIVELSMRVLVTYAHFNRTL
jgi:hypothetical protein